MVSTDSPSFSALARSAGRYLDRLKVGSVLTIQKRGRVVAQIRGVRVEDAAGLEVFTVVDLHLRRRELRLKVVREGGRVAVSRSGMIEAVIEPCGGGE